MVFFRTPVRHTFCKNTDLNVRTQPSSFLRHSFSGAFPVVYTGMLNRWIQTALCNSRNAVSFSSARTINRFPSPRCASVIQIVRPCVSIADTQPQLHPALLRASAMISQYFIRFRAAMQRTYDYAGRFELRIRVRETQPTPDLHAQ